MQIIILRPRQQLGLVSMNIAYMNRDHNHMNTDKLVKHKRKKPTSKRI